MSIKRFFLCSTIKVAFGNILPCHIWSRKWVIKDLFLCQKNIFSYVQQLRLLLVIFSYAQRQLLVIFCHWKEFFCKKRWREAKAFTFFECSWHKSKNKYHEEGWCGVKVVCLFLLGTFSPLLLLKCHGTH